MISYSVAESFGWQRQKRSMGSRPFAGSSPRRVLKSCCWVILCSSLVSASAVPLGLAMMITAWEVGWRLFGIAGCLLTPRLTSLIQVDAAVASVDSWIDIKSSWSTPNVGLWGWCEEPKLGTRFDPSICICSNEGSSARVISVARFIYTGILYQSCAIDSRK